MSLDNTEAPKISTLGLSGSLYGGSGAYEPCGVSPINPCRIFASHSLTRRKVNSKFCSLLLLSQKTGSDQHLQTFRGSNRLQMQVFSLTARVSSAPPPARRSFSLRTSDPVNLIRTSAVDAMSIESCHSIGAKSIPNPRGTVLCLIHLSPVFSHPSGRNRNAGQLSPP